MSRASILVVSAALVAAGCSSDVDSTAVARTLVQNTASLLVAADQDRQCGFDSASAQVTINGAPGSLGSATFTVADCALNFDDLPHDCADRRVLGGTAIVSGTRTIVGTVTGNPQMPIVADGPLATTIVLTARLDDFLGEGSHDSVTVLGVDGNLHAEAQLVRAAGVGGGCTVATPNVDIARMNLFGAKVEVIDGSNRQTLDVEESNIIAVQGRVSELENMVAGSIRVDGSVQDLTGALDEQYNPTAFLESYACGDALALPVTFECGAPSPAAAKRLGARSAHALALVAQLARTDPTCGFDTASPIVEATSATEASATKHIESCRIDLGAGRVVTSNCGQGETTASGVVTVTGRLRVAGRSTAQSVVPSSDDAMVYELTEVVFEGFGLARGDERIALTGVAAGRVHPRLARSDSSGLCTVPTPIVQLDDVALNGVIALIDTPTEHAQGVIERSTIDVTVGAWDQIENAVLGEVTIAGETHELSGRFDPLYDRTAFESDWQCGEAATKNPFVCDAATSLGIDIARASVLSLTTIGELIEADTTCGFSSEAVIEGVQISGAVGSSSGQGTFTVTNCAIEFGTPTVVTEDCYGRKTYAEGRAVVSGSKTITGWVTGDGSTPVLPTSRSGVRYELSVVTEGLRVHADEGTLAHTRLDVVRGSFGGTYVPRVAIDEDNGACTKLTPEAHVEGLAFADAVVRSSRAGRTLEAQVSGSSIFGTIGRHAEDDENRLSGQLTIDGQSITFTDADMHTDYDARRFVAGFSCRDGMFIPFDDADCDMRQVLGEVAARLLVQSIGAVTEVVNRDDFDCAFGGDDVYDDPSQAVGQHGEPGYIQWQIAGCRLRFRNNRQGTPFDTDCRDHDKYFDGAATVDAGREVRGIRDEIDVTFGSDVQYVHPLDPNATRIDYRSVDFEEFSTYVLAPGETFAEKQIFIHGGSLSGTVEPFTGPDDGSGDYFNQGDYDIATPVARISGLDATAIDATIRYDDKLFRVTIDGANIEAFNGSWVGAVGETNQISGTIMVDGRTIELQRRGELDPDYDQTTFDEAYVCTDRLLQTLPPE